MNCPQCHEPIPVESRFCEACGVPIGAPPTVAVQACETARPVCHCPPGAAKPDDAGFCEVCGVRLNGAAHPSITPPNATPAKPTEGFAITIDETLALVSDRGRHHLHNEDAGLVERLPNGRILIIVADGVSSSWRAKTASTTAVSTIRESILAAAESPLAEAVRAAILQADQAIKALPFEAHDARYDEPATTVVVALVAATEFVVGWVGDSRAYVIFDAAPAEQLLTTDDSWAALMVAQHKMTLEEALLDKQSRYLTQTLGMHDDDLQIHVSHFPIHPATLLLVCTDGLWNYFPHHGTLTSLIRNPAPCQGPLDSGVASICERLIAAANEGGGKDNITAAILAF